MNFPILHIPVVGDGMTIALNAVLRKAADKIYLIAPSGVEINDIGSIDRRY